MSKKFYNGEDFWEEKELPASDEIVKKAELKLGIKLPEEYIELLKEKIETTGCALIDNDKFYYLGSIYEALGRDIMNRNINKIDKHLAIKYLQGAFMYYKCCSGDYAELAIDHLKNYITNRL